MFPVIGLVVVFVMVFGGFVLAGGHFEVLLEAAPMEFMMIGGAAMGALIIANDMNGLKAVGGGVGKVLSGPKWSKKDYQDLLALLFQLTKLMKTKGIVALEPHIERPAESAIFQKYPKLSKDHFVVDFICDTLRMMTMSLEDPHQVETAMEKQLEKHHHEALTASHALTTMADGLPALGIVAAVLGVIKTMGSITEPPEILGSMIGGALVGTFLGVFLAYGLVGPIATRLKGIVDEEAQFYHVIRDILVAHLHGNSAQVSVEIGRGSVPSDSQPSFIELESALNSIPSESA
jgi:chemotaxis protein MotA